MKSIFLKAVKFSLFFFSYLVIFCLDVRVSNTLSTLSSTLLLSVSQPSPDGLVIFVLHSPLGVLPCVPLQQTGSMQVAFLGVPVTLQVRVGEGLATGFCWWFTQEGSEEIKDSNDGRTCVKTACFPDYGCLNSTLVCRTKWKRFLYHMSHIKLEPIFLAHLFLWNIRKKLKNL